MTPVNRTALKIIACISMLLDHIGYLLLPEVTWLRFLGRLAFPLFAFFIAEGCRYTSHKLRYFLQIFLLGIACQSVYLAEQIVGGFVYSFYLNILLTFSFSILVCFSYLFWEKQLESEQAYKKYGSAILFLFVIFLAIGVCALFDFIDSETYYEVSIDYGIAGILLPLSALIAKEKDKKVILFSIGIVLYCITTAASMPYVWFTLLDIPLLMLYNGEKGKSRFKYGFYLFYPLHLAVLYLISMLI